ncbi:MAG: hypothetical protein K2M47_07055 [Clostridiales bacterium]|nr:hypothetical protein [Clostridiales bacterium]
MACRKINTIFTRIFVSVAIVAVCALSWLAFSFASRKSARADEVQTQSETQLTHDQVFGANHANSRPFSLSDEEIVFVEPGKYSWPDKYFLKSSTFHLTEDVVLSNNLQMIASYFGDDTIITVNICLHGHSLTYKSSYAIDLAGDCTLNIYDCGGDDNHSGSIRGINITNAATVNLYSGAFKDYTKDSGVSVYGKIGDKNATFNMYGGTISGNGEDSYSGGGGVGIGSEGVFNMYGGTITGNTVTKKDGGGVRVGDVSATFHMYGGAITNNTITFKETDSDTVVTWYDGAGVYNNGGTFTMQGNVNITGNVKGKPSALSANNVKTFYKTNSDGSPVTDYEGNILYDGKIKITGQLAAGSQIGITMPSDHLTGVITSGYTESGNTQNPSVFFNCDNSGYSISYDEDLGNEAAVYEGEVVVGNYTMTSATAKSHVGTPNVGDTSISLNIEVTLTNADDNSTKTVMDVKTVACPALQVGVNTVSFDYAYKGVTKTVTYSITLDKVNAAVNWACTGATSTGTAAAERIYDGSNALSAITASYLGYDGTNVTVSGSDLIVKKGGATVSSIVEVGVYTISLPSSDIYNFSNGTFTLTVKEAPIDEGYYTMRSATAVVNGTYTAGATTVNVTVTATLKNTVNINDVTTATEVKQITVPALKAGNNEVKFTYVYNDTNGGSQTAQITVTVNAAKKSAAVQWYFNGTLASNNVAEYASNGIDVMGDISAKYTSYNGQVVTVNGLSGNIIVKDAGGNTVDSVRDEGVYTVSLAPDDNHQFTNNTFTLTVNSANVEDGYYRLQYAVADGVVGTATVGDTEITVTVKMTLIHTKNQDVKLNTVNTKVRLSTALHVGVNTVKFEYKHTGAPDDVQTVQLTVNVTAARKQVTVRWYFDGVLATNNAAKLVYSGTDASGKIVAEYDGYDGEVKRVDGNSVGIIKRDADGNAVSSLSAVGEYVLILAESTDYVFDNNMFTYTVAENIGDISDLTYEENDEVILGVSCDDGFEQGTEVLVEKVEDLDDGLVNGKISSALNVSFVNNSVEVNPTGVITVRVLIPDELKGKDYKIYNLKDGVATELRFTADGDYATFESNELSTILFVTQETPTPTPTPSGDKNVVIKLDDSGLVWVWVSVAIVVVCFTILTVVLVVLAKRKK